MNKNKQQEGSKTKVEGKRRTQRQKKMKRNIHDNIEVPCTQTKRVIYHDLGLKIATWSCIRSQQEFQIRCQTRKNQQSHESLRRFGSCTANWCVYAVRRKWILRKGANSNTHNNYIIIGTNLPQSLQTAGRKRWWSRRDPVPSFWKWWWRTAQS